ncbi:MAG: hypothetical protein VYB20_02165, partial [Pseudomonadota bacterium]|nr:hypothetical protein [Pseudomonadota bacterium]
LDRLNLSAQELNQLAPENQFERIAEAMQGVENSSERVRLAQQLWDSEGVKLVQIVNSGTDAIAAMRAEADALGLTISQDTANAMASYNDEVDRLKFAAQGVSQTLAAELIPSLTTGLQATNAFIQDVGGASRILSEVKDVATLTAVVFAGRYANSLIEATRRMIERNAASAAAAVADERSMQMTVRRTAAEKQTALALLSTARLEERAARGTDAHTAALTRLRLARERSIVATTNHTVAVNANNAAMARGTIAAQGMAAATRAGAGALALVGGPLGLLVGAGGLLYAFRDELGLTLPQIDANTTAVHKLTAGLDDMSQAAAQLTLTSLVGQLAEVRAQAEVTNETIRAVQNDDVTPTTGGFLGYSGEELLRQNEMFTEIGEASREAEQKAANLEAAIALVQDRLGELGRQSQEVTPTITEVGDATETAAKQTTTLANSYENLLDRIQPNRRAARQYAQDLGTLNLAYATGSINAVQYMQQMGRLQESFQVSQRETGNVVKEVTEQN